MPRGIAADPKHWGPARLVIKNASVIYNILMPVLMAMMIDY